MPVQEQFDFLAVLREKRDEILSIAAKYKATNVRIFGSVARGEETPDSDVDFLVTFLPGADIWGTMGLEIELENLLGRVVEVAGEDALRESWRERILKDAQPL
jgi:uncharacterized protein